MRADCHSVIFLQHAGTALQLMPPASQTASSTSSMLTTLRKSQGQFRVGGGGGSTFFAEWAEELRNCLGAIIKIPRRK